MVRRGLCGVKGGGKRRGIRGIWVGDRGGKDDGLNDCIGGAVNANKLEATKSS